MSLLGLPNEILHTVILHYRHEDVILSAIALTSRRLWEIAAPLLFASLVVYISADEHSKSLAAVLQQRPQLRNHVKKITFHGKSHDDSEKWCEVYEDREPDGDASIASSTLDLLDLIPQLHTIELLLGYSELFFNTYSTFLPSGLRSVKHIRFDYILNNAALVALIACLSLPALRSLDIREIRKTRSDRPYFQSESQSLIPVVHSVSIIVDPTVKFLTANANMLGNVLTVTKGLKTVTFRACDGQASLSASDTIRDLEGSRETLETLSLQDVTGGLPSLSNFCALRSLHVDWPMLTPSTVPLTINPPPRQPGDPRVVVDTPVETSG